MSEDTNHIVNGLDFEYEFNEAEFRVEEQDLRILKGILTSKEKAKEFVNIYDESLFIGDAKRFAKALISYVKAFKDIPTKRTLTEEAKDDLELVENIDFIYEELEKIQFNKQEFDYDLLKLKDRFTKHKIENLRDSLDDVDLENDIDWENTIRQVRKEIEEAESVRKGTRTVYTQKTLKDYLPEFKEDYARKIQNPELGQGILTGYSYLDYISNGLYGSEMAIIAADTGMGKALPLDTPIPTPNGMINMGDISPGSQIFGRDGKVYSVVAESKIMKSPGWKFIFNDGSEIISHDNHEWLTFDRKEQVALSKRDDGFRKRQREYKFKKGICKRPNKAREGLNIKAKPTGTIRTSLEIANSIKTKDGRNNHAIPLTSPVDLPHRDDLLIDPYVLGLWLGDGHSRDGCITTMDKELAVAIHKTGYEYGKIYKRNLNDKASQYRFLGLRKELKKLGVFRNKHIPEKYLFSSKQQRLSLLQGLMDSDGTANKGGNVEFTNTNKKIIDGVYFLLVSLGERASIKKGKAKLFGRIISDVWDIHCTPYHDVFRLPRKLERQNLSKRRLNKFRYIKSVERTKSVKMKCIQVSSPDSMYLAGNDFIPTHNSMMLNNMAIQMWMQKNTVFTDPQNYGKGHNILYFSLEMPFAACFRRTLACLADLPIYGIRDCKIPADKINRLNSAAKFIDQFPYTFEIVDIPRGVTVEQIEARYNESIAAGNNPEVVIVDYMGLMDTNENINEDWLKLNHIAANLHEFGRVYDVPTLTAVQLNRPQKNVKDSSELIGLHRIGRSSLILHHANIAIQLEKRKDEHTYSDLIYHIIKNRDGELGNHILYKKFSHATLRDMDEPYQPPTDDGFAVVNNEVEDISKMLENIGWYGLEEEK